METNELKFLLKLLGFEGYRALLSKIKLSATTSAAERDRVFRKLCDRRFVDCSYDVSKFKIAPPGKFLLEQGSDELPLTDQEFRVLQECAKSAITPAETGIPAEDRQAVIQNLADRGLIQVKAKDKKIKEVWLTSQGKEYLLHEYDPRGAGTITLTKTMLADYLQFLRQALSFSKFEVEQTAAVPQQEAAHQPNEEEVFKTIVDLDRRLHTRNYLPIFYLRDELQPPLSREDLDRVLYRLEKKDKIELRAIEEAWRYSNEEFNAGIPQRAGSRLFFIKVT